MLQIDSAPSARTSSLFLLLHLHLNVASVSASQRKVQGLSLLSGYLDSHRVGRTAA